MAAVRRPIRWKKSEEQVSSMFSVHHPNSAIQRKTKITANSTLSWKRTVHVFLVKFSANELNTFHQPPLITRQMNVIMPWDVRPLNMRYLYPIQTVVKSPNTMNVVSQYHWARFGLAVSNERLEVLSATILNFFSIQPQLTFFSFCKWCSIN